MEWPRAELFIAACRRVWIVLLVHRAARLIRIDRIVGIVLLACDWIGLRGRVGYAGIG